nr:hypothetical protein [Clostridia bacterium]
EEKGIPAVLCFYFHPWEFEPCKAINMFGEGGTIVDEFIVKGTGDYAVEQFDKLIGMMLAEGEREFVRADELAKMNW